MAPKPRRRAQDNERPAPSQDATARCCAPRSTASSLPQGAQLWLFPDLGGLRRALAGRCGETRQMSCARGRLAVLARGGAGVQLHLLRGVAGKPDNIKLEGKMKIYSVDQGAEQMLILSSDGKLFEYNYRIKPTKLPCVLQEKIIIQVACGDYHSLALSKGGELLAWGQNSHGQLGVGGIGHSISTPQTVVHLTGVPVAQISAGEAHSMALSISGNIYSWGRNDLGQLGLGHTDSKDFPSLIEELDKEVEFLTCGGSHTVLLTKDGRVFTFGAGKYGQLGHDSTQNELRPRLVTALFGNRVTQIACGRYHTLAYVSDLGKVFSFGCGSEGQLGNGGTHNQLIPLPMKLPSEELRLENHTSGKELIMIAGENQSILLWMKKENAYVNLRRNIPTLNEKTVKRWNANVGTKQWQNTKREIKEIFSSPACLTGSFLRKRTAAETKSIDLDLNKARDFFKTLTQKDCIANTITTSLRKNLLTNLLLHSPHQEALGVFLLLLECLVIQESDSWDSLVIPFAEAVYKISNEFSEILETYWASLEESAFGKLVQMVKRAIVSCWPQNAGRLFHTKVLLEMLKKLHRVNQTKYKLPENIFNINELTYLLDFDAEASEGRFMPFAVQGGFESSLLPTFNLEVRRSNLVEDVFNQLNRFETENLRKELLVSFSGEIGYDFGGVRTEFFQCIFEEMTQPEYGMFIYPEETSNMWFPVRPKFEKRYFLFGVLCGLSLYNFNVANIPFPLALFKKLLNQTPSLEDLKELSPVLGKCLQMLLDHEGDDFAEVFYIHFHINWDQNYIELIPNGRRIMVDHTNKRDYVSKYVDYIFNTSVKEAYEEFHRGFYRVCDKDIIEIFHPEELREVIIGNADYDWEAFEKNAHYEQGYSRSHPTIIMFWEALHKLTLEEKKKFLVFLTGSDRLPIKGLRNMKITFYCPEIFNENTPMRAQTCFSTLILPKYSTMGRMEEALQLAIKHERGFG
ncbi:E3 ISG15--protein ligase HERC5 [Rhynchocyon petersi]